MANELDQKRERDLNHPDPERCIDHEYDERQKPLVEPWGMRKHYVALRQSPLVSNKDRNSKKDPWGWQRMDRRRAHGW